MDTVKSEEQSLQQDRNKKYESEMKFNLHQLYPQILKGASMHSNLSEQSRQWRFFSKQEDLLECYQAHRSLHLLPFAYQDSLRGTRIFVLVHPLELLFRTQNRLVNYFYEIIAENVPCKLYLDLEFDLKANPHVDGDKMTNLVIELCLQQLNSKMCLTLDKSVVLELESSTSSKFSRHVVFNTVFSFENNLVVGEIVKEITQNGEHPQLMVLKKDGTKSCIVDLGVYTRNRHFRILGSTKFGRNAPLVLSEACKSRLNCTLSCDVENIFLSTLVTESNGPILPYMPLELCRTLPAAFSSAPIHQGQASTLPELDAYFTKLLDPVGLKKVLVYPSGCMVFSSGPKGFCLNKGSAHKNHRVYWIVESKLGVFYQKCGDNVDCKDFRSPRQTLPEPLLLRARGPLDAWESNLSAISTKP